MTSNLRISHSQKQTFLRCPRSWEMRYKEGLTRANVSDKAAMMLGSAVHAGIASALEYLYITPLKSSSEVKELYERMVVRAKVGCSEWVTKNTLKNKQRYIPNAGYQLDTSYYAMMKDVEKGARELLTYYLPLMQLGVKYMPVSKAELYGVDDILNVGPCVEMPFEYVISEIEDREVKMSGTIDAIMRNMDTGELIIFDFKVRGMFGYDQIAGLDDQLFTYAAVLSRMGIRVDSVCMFQIRSKLPAIASISKKSLLPNDGGDRGFDTTRERWIDTLPRNIDPKQWLPKLEGKFKPLTDFLHPVFMAINSDVLNMTYANLLSTVKYMLYAKDVDSYPAVLNTNVCKMCEYAAICKGLQYGGNPASIIANEYERKASFEELEDIE